jgi:hypothetical protein
MGFRITATGRTAIVQGLLNEVDLAHTDEERALLAALCGDTYLIFSPVGKRLMRRLADREMARR